MAENKETDSNGRYFFLDILRTGAICAVVMLHTITGVMDTVDMSGYPSEKTVFLIGMDMITWCVPVFVIISGFLFLRPERVISFRTMLTKYCRRILLALFLFGTPYACLELVITHGGFTADMPGRSLLMVLQGKSWSHMWYLYLIFFLYLFTPLLKKLLAVLPGWTVLSVMGLLLLGSSALPFVRKLASMGGGAAPALPLLPDAGIYVFYYLCGYLLAVKRNVYGAPGVGGGRRIWALLAGIFALCGGMAASRLAGGYTVQMAYNYPPTVLLSLLLVCAAWVAEPFWRAHTGKRLRSFAAMSFTIYLIHPVCLNVFYKFLHLTPLSFPVWLSLPFFFGTAMLFSVCGALLLGRIPVLRKYVL